MATFNLRGFASPETLKRIEPEVLREFLLRFAKYFASRGLPLDREALDYGMLATILITPVEDIPTALVDALYLIHEMATEDRMEQLLSACGSSPNGGAVDLGHSPDLSPADFAIRVWLSRPDLLERKHSEQFVTARRSFQHFASKKAADEIGIPSSSLLRGVESEMSSYFAEKKKGDVVRVVPCPRPDGLWFLIRHGGTFRREGAVKDGASASVFYRPEEHDVASYHAELGELRVNTRGHRGETDLVRRSFGLHLFGSKDHFPKSTKKYTLEPLRTDGIESLTCSDLEGIDEIVLTELVYYWGGAQGEIEIRKAADLFSAMNERGRTIPRARLASAKFKVKFADARTARSVQVRPPNVTSYTRDDDGPLVEEWLLARGFAAKPEHIGNGRA